VTDLSGDHGALPSLNSKKRERRRLATALVMVHAASAVCVNGFSLVLICLLRSIVQAKMRT
jgi:hypothetical protein